MPTANITMTLGIGAQFIANEGPDLFITTDAFSLALTLGERPAERAVIADRLIDALQEIRAVAVRQAIEAGETADIGAGTFVRADITAIADRLPPGSFYAPELHEGPCPWGFDNAGAVECAAYRERSVAGKSNDIPGCSIHGAHADVFCDFPSSVSDRTCILLVGHQADSATRFHRFTRVGRHVDVDDRPGFPTCTIEGHALGCPGAAGGEHQLVAVADGDHFAGRPD